MGQARRSVTTIQSFRLCIGPSGEQARIFSSHARIESPAEQDDRRGGQIRLDWLKELHRPGCPESEENQFVTDGASHREERYQPAGHAHSSGRPAGRGAFRVRHIGGGDQARQDRAEDEHRPRPGGRWDLSRKKWCVDQVGRNRDENYREHYRRQGNPPPARGPATTCEPWDKQVRQNWVKIIAASKDRADHADKNRGVGWVRAPLSHIPSAVCNIPQRV